MELLFKYEEKIFSYYVKKNKNKCASDSRRKVAGFPSGAWFWGR